LSDIAVIVGSGSLLRAGRFRNAPRKLLAPPFHGDRRAGVGVCVRVGVSVGVSVGGCGRE